MTDDRTVVRITVDGTDYEVCFDECTALDAKECRRQTGLSLSAIFGGLADGQPDIDSVAALVWLARRQNGEPALAFDTVAGMITYGSVIGTPADSEVAADPE